MAYLVGATTVIDNSGNIDWARITGKPTIGDITGVTVTNSAASAGPQIHAAVAYGATTNCYVASLSGGGTSGDVTITANIQTFNCACQCRC